MPSNGVKRIGASTNYEENLRKNFKWYDKMKTSSTNAPDPNATYDEGSDFTRKKKVKK